MEGVCTGKVEVRQSGRRNGMKQVFPVGVAVVLGAVVSLAGCNPPKLGKKAEVAKPPGYKTTLVVVPGGQSGEFWKAMRAGVDDAARKHDIVIEWSATKTDPPSLEEQKKLVRAATDKQVEGILVAPVARVGMVPAIDKASKKRVPIVVIESGADTNFQLALISSHNEQVGALVASHVGQITGGTGKVGLVVNQSRSFSVSEREISFVQSLSMKSPGNKLVSTHDGVTGKSKIASDTSKMLDANPDLKAIVAFDEEATLTALKALRSRKLTGKVKLVGLDAGAQALAALKGGEIEALVVQNPYQMGSMGVDAIMEFRKTSNRQVKRIYSSSALITKASLNRPEGKAALTLGVPEKAKK